MTQFEPPIETIELRHVFQECGNLDRDTLNAPLVSLQIVLWSSRVILINGVSSILRLNTERYAGQDKGHSYPRIYHVVSSAQEQRRLNEPRDITLPSAYHSPRTVNKNAKELVMGTVKLSSTTRLASADSERKCLDCTYQPGQ